MLGSLLALLVKWKNIKYMLVHWCIHKCVIILIKFINLSSLVRLRTILVVLVWLGSILVLLVKCLIIKDGLVRNYCSYALPLPRTLIVS